MVGVAQLVRAPGCGPGCRGFESPRSPPSRIAGDLRVWQEPEVFLTGLLGFLLGHLCDVDHMESRGVWCRTAVSNLQPLPGCLSRVPLACPTRLSQQAPWRRLARGPQRDDRPGDGDPGHRPRGPPDPACHRGPVAGVEHEQDRQRNPVARAERQAAVHNPGDHQRNRQPRRVTERAGAQRELGPQYVQRMPAQSRAGRADTALAADRRGPVNDPGRSP
jgi:hypothetical protein